jgi:hypothetical protein
MMYQVFNHNDTFLGEFATKEEAEAEAMFYMEQTGNAAYVQIIFYEDKHE